MTHLRVLMYTAFTTLIGCSVYITKSGTPLWALLLFPKGRPIVTTSYGKSNGDEDGSE